MKKTLALLALVTPFLFATAHAEEKKQTKLAECSAAAKGKTGKEYTDARDACMKGQAPAAEKKQTKLAECSAAAKGKTGDEYTKARDACMKAKK